MASRLGEFVEGERHRNFVGRRPELAGFNEAIAGRSPCRVLFVHGPGGIGKTTLLHEMRARAHALGREPVLVDGREVDASPHGFEQAVSAGGAKLLRDGEQAVSAGGAKLLRDGEQAVSAGGAKLLRDGEQAASGGRVLLVDGYEHLAPIDSWLRSEFLPGLDADAVVVLAGREPPVAAWRVDAGWRNIVAVHALAPLDAVESEALLARAGVAEIDRQRLTELGRGHPLALALLADVARTGLVPQSLSDVPTLVRALLDSLVQEAPTQAHVEGLATCALAWTTTEDLLREVVGDEAPAVWAWLERQPFLVSGPRGLAPHELARDVLDSEFDRRSPERYRALHRAVHDHAVRCLREAASADRQLRAQHLLHLHRKAPFTAAIHTLRAKGSTAVVPGHRDEHEEILALIERFEGPRVASIAAAWFAEQPEGLNVVRTDGGVGGYSFHLLHPTGSGLESRDPVTRAVLEYVAAHGPVRPGERVSIARFFGGRHEHQRDLHAVLAGPVSSLVEWMTRPLAWAFVIIKDTGYWGPVFDYLGFGRLLAVEDQTAYGIDWRRLPLPVWLELMNEREHSGGTGPPPPGLLRPPALDRAAFAAAVRSALADLSRPQRLAANPLASSSFVEGSLKATLERAIAQVGADPKVAAVLHRTFVRAAPTQEAAAEVLGLPFSTYRRHLAKAIDELTDLLWAAEIGEVRLPMIP